VHGCGSCGGPDFSETRHTPHSRQFRDGRALWRYCFLEVKAPGSRHKASLRRVGAGSRRWQASRRHYGAAWRQYGRIGPSCHWAAATDPGPPVNRSSPLVHLAGSCDSVRLGQGASVHAAVAHGGAGARPGAAFPARGCRRQRSSKHFAPIKRHSGRPAAGSGRGWAFRRPPPVGASTDRRARGDRVKGTAFHCGGATRRPPYAWPWE
jgi:hypothetical protein